MKKKKGETQQTSHPYYIVIVEARHTDRETERQRDRETTPTLSSTISMEKSFPSPRELLQVRTLLLLVTRARMVHLAEEREMLHNEPPDSRSHAVVAGYHGPESPLGMPMHSKSINALKGLVLLALLAISKTGPKWGRFLKPLGMANRSRSHLGV